MADKLPNYFVEQQRIKTEIANQRSTIARQYLEIMEMSDRKSRILENIEAAQAVIDDREQKLQGLINEHGSLNELEFLQTIRGI